MSRTWLSRVCAISLAIALPILTAACGASGSSASLGSSARSRLVAARTGVGGGTLISQQEEGSPDWVQTLDPADANDSISISNIWMVDANLVKLDWPSLNPIPDLASSWSVSSDRRIWTFHLRPKAKFSNGDPVTAQDAVWSITRALLPATKSPGALLYLGEIVGAQAVANGKSKILTGVKTLSARTVQIKLQDPIAFFLGTLAYPIADVLDRRVMQGKSPSSYLTNTCKGNVGAGPFEFVCQNGSSSRNSFYPSGHSPYMMFKPNPYYYGKKPRIQVKAPFIADSQTNWRIYQSGAIDETLVPSADFSTARKMHNFFQVPTLATDYITTNTQQPPFSNRNCRLALAYAIDRPSIDNKLLLGTQYPLYDVIPQGLPGGGQGYFSAHADVPHYDPKKAIAYLNRCPGKLNNIQIVYQNTSQDLTHEYDVVQANLRAIGANVTTKPVGYNAWAALATTPMSTTHTQAIESLWVDDYADAQDWLQNLLATGASNNIGGYHNSAYDALVSNGNIERNPTKRAQIYTRAQKIALNDGGWIGIGGVESVFVIRPRVHGVVIASGLVLPLHNDWSNVRLS